VIAEGTRPTQKTVVGELDNIVARVKEHSLIAPAIIVVGEVVRLREKLGWFENRPLFGRRILVTRARHQAGILSRLLAARGAQPVELPAIEIGPVPDTKELDQAIVNLGQYQWLIFTSANGVAAFFDRLYALSLDARALKGLKITAIGPATSEALTDRGVAPDYMPAIFTSEGIIAGLKSAGISGQRFLLPRADIADEELTRGIDRLGGRVDEIAVYRTVPAPEAISQAKQMLETGEIDVITFTSSSTVANLMAAFEGKKAKIAAAKVACIGPKTAATATKVGLKVDILAQEQTIAGLVQAIEDYFREGA
jgi:uroporphyrinogen III methyltransferase/synthase